MVRGPRSTRRQAMKTRRLLVASSLVSALAGATPALAGPLGIVSGGVGAIGTLGGSLSGMGSNPALGVGSMIGATGQFQGAVTSPNLVIDRAPIRSAIGTVHTVGERARGRAQGATEAALSTTGSAAGEAASTVSAAGEAQAAAQGAGEVAVPRPGRVSATPRLPSLGADASASAAG